jgi:hypothetical protein
MSCIRDTNSLNKRGESWIGGAAIKQKSVNPVPLSTASTAAPSPRVVATQSPPPGFSDHVVGPPVLATGPPPGTFVNDCPPSPSLTKRLLGHAQARKRAGRHNLVSMQPSATGVSANKRILKLSVASAPQPAESQPIDRWGIADDLYESLLNSAKEIKKSSGQHQLHRRRLGLSGEVEPVLVIQSVAHSSRVLKPQFTYPPHSTVSLFSLDPSKF